MVFFSLAIRIVVAAAMLVGLAFVGRALSPKWRRLPEVPPAGFDASYPAYPVYPADPSNPDSQAARQVAKDPTAWRALAVAAGLGLPAVGVAGLTALIEALIRGTCEQDPGQVCGGLPDDGVYATMLVGLVGFAGPLAVVLTLNRPDQRAWRWVWAWAAVVVPVLTTIVAINAGRTP